MIGTQADAMREECALRLGLPADTDAIDVIRAVLAMTHEDITLTDLQGIAREMGGRIKAVLT